MQVKFIAYPVTVLGPGKRIGIWTCGCYRRCPYCASPELQEFDEFSDIPLGNLLSQVKEYLAAQQVDGVTISGGEPFAQEDLLSFLHGLKDLGIEDILVYTGNTIEELRERLPNVQEYLSNIDVLIDGPYIEELNDGLNLRGSSNQRILFLNKAMEKKYQACLKEERRYQAKPIDENKTLFIGLPKKSYVKERKKI